MRSDTACTWFTRPMHITTPRQGTPSFTCVRPRLFLGTGFPREDYLRYILLQLPIRGHTNGPVRLYTGHLYRLHASKKQDCEHQRGHTRAPVPERALAVRVITEVYVAPLNFWASFSGAFPYHGLLAVPMPGP